MILLAAFILDLFLADPYHWPHPVKAMGAYIQYYQRFFKVHQQSEARKKYLGLGLVVSLLAITGFTGAGLLYLVGSFIPCFIMRCPSTSLTAACRCRVWPEKLG